MVDYSCALTHREDNFYLTYYVERNRFWWYYETELESEPYCTNVNRGKKLITNVDTFFDDLKDKTSMNYVTLQKYIHNFLTPVEGA
jgi:hypothetical protein